MKKKLLPLSLLAILLIGCAPQNSNSSSLTDSTTNGENSSLSDDSVLDSSTDDTTSDSSSSIDNSSNSSSSSNDENEEVFASIAFTSISSKLSVDNIVANEINISSISQTNIWCDVGQDKVRLGTSKNTSELSFTFDSKYKIGAVEVIGATYGKDTYSSLGLELQGASFEGEFTSDLSSMSFSLDQIYETNTLSIKTLENGSHRFNLQQINLTLNGKSDNPDPTPDPDPDPDPDPTPDPDPDPNPPITYPDNYKDLFDNTITPSRGSLGSVDSYYESCRGLKGTALKEELRRITTAGFKQFSYDHLKQSFPYTEENPHNKGYMTLAYTGEQYKISTFGGSFTYTNREHTWPDSLGVGKTGPGADKHMQRICEQKINSKRGHMSFGTVTDKTGENDLGNSNPINEGNYAGNDYFEPKDEFKGDTARIVFYMAMRYESLEVSGYNIDTSRFNTYKSSYALGNFNDMYRWATSGMDPISDFEVNRNNVIDSKYQNNRNPFVDHPEFLIMIYDKTYNGSGALNDF